MKLDPNQLVGGFLASVLVSEHPVTGDQSFEDKHVGGIPLRLSFAKDILAARIAFGDVNVNELQGDYEHQECLICLHWADALIAAHNATAGEVGGG